MFRTEGERGGRWGGRLTANDGKGGPQGLPTSSLRQHQNDRQANPMAQSENRNTPPVIITVRPLDSSISYDRYVAKTEFRLSAQASALVGPALTSREELTFDVLALSMEKSANAGLPEVAVELAGIFSEIAKELMRGRSCTAEIT